MPSFTEGILLFGIYWITDMQTNVHGLETAYTDQGSGPVVIMLHGWGTNKENFSELSSELRDHFRVIAVDLPGFGETAMLASNADVEDYVDFVRAFLQTLEISDVYTFIAHSFGGRICVKGLSSGKLQAEKLVLIGSAGIAHDKTMRDRAYAAVAKTGKLVMKLPGLRGKYDAARAKLHATAGSTDYANAGAMQQVFLNTIHEDLRENIRALMLPTLLIWGANDTETPLADARFFHENIPGSSLKILQRAGHFVHNEQPDKVLRFIEEFLT